MRDSAHDIASPNFTPTAARMASAATARRTSFWPWPGMIFVLLGGNVIVVAATIWCAHADQGFVIVPGYDVKAAQHQDQIDAEMEWRALGWRVEFDPAVAGSALALRIIDGEGRTLGGEPATARSPSEPTSATSSPESSGSITAITATVFHHATARERRTVSLGPAGDGRWILAPGVSRPGRWRVDLVISATTPAGPATIERELDIDVHGSGDAFSRGASTPGGEP